MKKFLKFLTTVAAVAGIVFLIVKYMDQILAWINKVVIITKDTPDEETDAPAEQTEEAAPAEEAVEEAAEEPAAEEPQAEAAPASKDDSVVEADEEDFEK